MTIDWVSFAPGQVFQTVVILLSFLLARGVSRS